ncbi:MAG: ATP-binding protein [Pseudomonadota bacterium]
MNTQVWMANIHDLEAELDWLSQVLQARLKGYFTDPSVSVAFPNNDLLPPSLEESVSPYANFIKSHTFDATDRLLIILALTPYLRPQLLDVFWSRNEITQRGFTEFGGAQGAAHGGFLPTCETAIFLVGSDQLESRFATLHRLDPNEKLARLEVMHCVPTSTSEPGFNGLLQVTRRFLGVVTHGVEHEPSFDQSFPARRVHTTLEWKDLVLPASTLEQLNEVQSWLKHGATLLHDWGMEGKLRPGYTSLFCGPPGTGKTLSACLLGKLCGCELYKIDLSMVVSKYIGETEKNLARIFDQAEHRGWILFFDEADALFGKRTRVDDAHDRYANQEVSFLLQRIEEFDGVVILASNLKHNIDDAFLRRFQSVVQFPMPRAPERLRLWREAFPERVRLEESLDLPRLAERHELSGGTIMNVVRYASLRAVSRATTSNGPARILADDVEEGIRRELMKEGRAF